MTINIESEATCRKAYINYHCYNNTMGITSEEMAEITQKWQSRLSSWQKSVASDETEYDFDDSEFETYKENGKKATVEKTGYEGGGKGKMWKRGVYDGLTTLGTNIVAQTAFKEVGKTAGKEVTEKAAVKKAAASDIATVCFAAAEAAIYYLKKPNKEQVEACNTLQDVMTDNQGALTDAQSEMATMDGELIDLSDEANEANEDANDDIKEKKTDYDTYKAAYEELKAKVESGEPLTESEKELYKEIIKKLGATGEDITTIQEDASDAIGEIYEDMETYQDGYDYAAETMGEVQGSTDYAESFDGATKTLCYVEAGIQTINAGSATLAAIRLAGKAFVGWFFAAIGVAAAAACGMGATEQFKWAGQVGNEISMREETQDMNDATMDMYDEEIDCYDGFMQGVEDLEIDIPDDVAPVENAPDPNTNSNSAVPTGTPDPLNPTGVKKKEDEKE